MRLVKTRSKGFTLVELMVVMSIIAILAAIVMPQVTGVTSVGRGTTKTNDIKVVQETVERFVGDNPKGNSGWPVGYTIAATPVATDGSGALPATGTVPLRWDSFFVKPGSSTPTTFDSYMRKLPPHAIDTTGKTASATDTADFKTYLESLAAKTPDGNGKITPPTFPTLTTSWPTSAVWTLDSTGSVGVNLTDEKY